MPTKKTTEPKLTKASDTKLSKIKRGRSDLQEAHDEVIAGLAAGTVKVGILTWLDSDGELHHFVTDGTASRVEIVGLVSMLQNALVEQQL